MLRLLIQFWLNLEKLYYPCTLEQEHYISGSKIGHLDITNTDLKMNFSYTLGCYQSYLGPLLIWVENHGVVSCLFRKQLFSCSFITIDSTEILCMSNCSSSIAGHFIPSTFFCGSAVCLLISQNINKELIKFWPQKLSPS